MISRENNIHQTIIIIIINIIMADFNVERVRSRFPALNGKQVYFDNAGGSQVLKEVIDSYVYNMKLEDVESLISNIISTQNHEIPLK